MDGVSQQAQLNPCKQLASNIVLQSRLPNWSPTPPTARIKQPPLLLQVHMAGISRSHLPFWAAGQNCMCSLPAFACPSTITWIVQRASGRSSTAVGSAFVQATVLSKGQPVGQFGIVHPEVRRPAVSAQRSWFTASSQLPTALLKSGNNTHLTWIVACFCPGAGGFRHPLPCGSPGAELGAVRL